MQPWGQSGSSIEVESDLLSSQYEELCNSSFFAWNKRHWRSLLAPTPTPFKNIAYKSKQPIHWFISKPCSNGVSNPFPRQETSIRSSQCNNSQISLEIIISSKRFSCPPICPMTIMTRSPWNPPPLGAGQKWMILGNNDNNGILYGLRTYSVQSTL